MNSNKTLHYLVPFFTLYTKDFIRAYGKLVKTGIYVHEEGHEEYYGNSLFLKCPKDVNYLSNLNSFGECEEVKDNFFRKNSIIFIIDFPFSEIFEEIVYGTWDLKDSEVIKEVIDKPYMSHIKSILYKEDKAIKRLLNIFKEELGIISFTKDDLIKNDLPLEIPFSFEKESLFSLNEEKYLKSVYEE